MFNTASSTLNELTKQVDLTSLNFINLAILTCVVAVLVQIQIYLTRSRRRTPRLNGPPSTSWLFGATKVLFESADLGVQYGIWEKEYGLIYDLPSSLGSKMLVLADPKAVAHFFARDTSTYHQPEVRKIMNRQFFGDILLDLEGEDHKKERKIVSLALSNSAVRNIAPFFLDSAYELTAAWNSSLECNTQGTPTGYILIEVAKWMERISLDSVGNGGFTHDFGSLKGHHSALYEALESFAAIKPTFPMVMMILLGPHFPFISSQIPNEGTNGAKLLSKRLKEISGQLLAKARKEVEMNEESGDGSILKSLVRFEGTSSNEQMESRLGILLAAYEPTAITLTWALIELARHPKIQETLRSELQKHISSDQDISYELLTHSLPYLDAFVCEILRLHPVVQEIIREANEEDTIPLSHPITATSGAILDSLPIAKGTHIRIPIVGVNRSEALWGSDAATFDPARWLESSERTNSKLTSARKEEIQGYRHLLTFSSGPRMCLGRNFALVGIKAVLSVLIRNFSFELPGPDTDIGVFRSIGIRPMVVGEDGPKVPLVIKKVRTE